MTTILRSFLGSLLAIVAVVGVAAGVIALKSDEKPKVEEGSWLVIDLYGPLPEYDLPSGLLGTVMGGGDETLQRVLDNLRKAARDERIAGVALKLSSNFGAGPAKVQEIREGVRRVRQSGKPVLAWGDSFDRATFVLAAACDSVFAAPNAYVSFTGFATTSLHLRDLLGKLGVEPQLHAIKDYKSAAEMVTRRDMSPSVRRNREWILDDLWQVYAETMAAERGLPEARLLELMAVGPMRPEEAAAFGLLDGVCYWDELEQRISGDPEERPDLVAGAAYAKIPETKLGLEGDKKVAVVHAQGMIGGRESRVDPFLGPMMGHETVAGDLRRAAADEDVAAIVLRVDSGGGDALTSDLIGHAVEVAGRKKPVVVSMVDVAASGGYHIAYRAGRILACPLTITGSIGSISGKMNLGELYAKLGVGHDHVARGPMALLDADDRGYTPEERARFEANHWADFNAWLRDVAEHRGLAFAEAESLAHGRIWTGRQAAANRLVDAVGGFEDAIASACELAGLPPEAKVTLVHYPEHRGLLQSLLSGDEEPIGDRAAAWLLYRLVHRDLAETWNLLAGGRLAVAEPLGDLE